MIRVRRPKRVPPVLKKKGATARANHCTRFANGERAFTFNPSIYGHGTVKKALVKAQNEKCCFCESSVTHVSSGHIEHFRPKGGVRQSADAPLEKPGYFWLAYEWTNLLFSCELCNSRFKKNLFPLVRPDQRACDPAADLAREEPLFLDPSSEDPTIHIGYREEYPYAIDGSRRGEVTWRALGLDREKLAELRRDHIATIKALKALRDRGKVEADRTEAAKLLRKLQGPKAQWSAMVRAALADQ